MERGDKPSRSRLKKRLRQEILLHLGIIVDVCVIGWLTAVRLTRLKRAHRELRKELAALETVSAGKSGAHAEQKSQRELSVRRFPRPTARPAHE